MDLRGRADERYGVRLPIELLFARGPIAAETEDVSLRGLFVRTDAQVPRGQLIRLRVRLPGSHAWLPLCAVVAFCRTPTPSRRLTGMGARLFGVGGTERKIWEAYIDTLRRSRVRPSAPMKAVPVLPRQGAYAPVLQVQPASEFDLTALFTRELSRGTVLVQTTAPLSEGDDVVLELMHPRTAALYPIAGTVHRCVREARMQGVVLELPLTDVQRESLRRFAVGRVEAQSSSAPELELPPLHIEDASARIPAQIVVNV